jgi:anti-sigma regulatory factor (Ser/Thr protein kinase)
MTPAADRLRRLVDERGEVANRDAAAALGVSPATAHRLLRSLVVAGVLERHGKGPAARYRLRRVGRRFSLRGLQEDRVWRRVNDEIALIRPLGEEESQSLQYAATEVINNAVEHARGRRVEVDAEFAARATTVVRVRDDGVGVFRRICEDFGFPSAQDAIVALEKGKLTSDPARHSGEGLFFSSKAVSRFRLESQRTAWIVDNVVGDSAIAPSTVSRGTSVRLEVVRGRTPRLVEVFAAYADPESLRFARTRATVKLGAHPKTLVSRSEARRLTQDLTKFTHVTLDFSGVETVGQGFCDEVFRVFARSHPEVALEPVGMNEAVAFMVARVRGGSRVATSRP